MIGHYIVFAALAAVAAVLFAGFAVMVAGGRTATKWSNVVMRLRIVVQGVAFLLICLVAGFSSL